MYVQVHTPWPFYFYNLINLQSCNVFTISTSEIFQSQSSNFCNLPISLFYCPLQFFEDFNLEILSIFWPFHFYNLKNLQSCNLFCLQTSKIFQELSSFNYIKCTNYVISFLTSSDTYGRVVSRLIFTSRIQ